MDCIDFATSFSTQNTKEACFWSILSTFQARLGSRRSLSLLEASLSVFSSTDLLPRNIMALVLYAKEMAQIHHAIIGESCLCCVYESTIFTIF